MKKLFKTTIIIWSEYDGDEDAIVDLAQAAMDGEAYCSKQESQLIADPSTDPDWDGTEFFGDLEDEEDENSEEDDEDLEMDDDS